VLQPIWIVCEFLLIDLAFPGPLSTEIDGIAVYVEDRLGKEVTILIQEVVQPLGKPPIYLVYTVVILIGVLERVPRTPGDGFEAQPFYRPLAPTQLSFAFTFPRSLLL